MFELPQQYGVNKKIPIKTFIPSDLKPLDKKKLKANIRKVVLTYQIKGEEIPSTLDETVDYQEIPFFEIEIVDINKASSIAAIYQNMIKSPCVLRFSDNEKELYSFALKRLNQNDKTQMIVTDSFTSDVFCNDFFATEKDMLLNVINFPTIVNKQNKYSLYVEMYVKGYIITNENVYAKGKDFLSKPIWYDTAKVLVFYRHLRNLVTKKNLLAKATTNAEKVKLNKEIRVMLAELEEENYE